MRLPVLLTGAAGQVGQEVARLDWPEKIELVRPSRSELDISDQGSVAAFFSDVAPAAVINCAAYTAVDRAEEEVAQAYAVNAWGPAWLASAARAANIPLVHVSTDYVFGSGAGFRQPDEVPAPASVYGASKLAGEIALRASGAHVVILRTAWVLSPFRSNFLKTMLRLARERDEISVVADQVGCPTAAGDIARALQTILLRLLDDPDAPLGTYHFVNAGEASWAGLATAIMADAAAAGLPTARIKPISTNEYPALAKRPQDSRLSVTSLELDYPIRPRAWEAAVQGIVQELAAADQTGGLET